MQTERADQEETKKTPTLIVESAEKIGIIPRIGLRHTMKAGFAQGQPWQ
jgi:hypothetical protein